MSFPSRLAVGLGDGGRLVVGAFAVDELRKARVGRFEFGTDLVQRERAVAVRWNAATTRPANSLNAPTVSADPVHSGISSLAVVAIWFSFRLGLLKTVIQRRVLCRGACCAG